MATMMASVRQATTAGMFMCLALTVAGCSSTTDSVPPTAYSATMVRPVPADVYPVIEGARPVAGPQMSNEDAAAEGARLTAASGRRSSGQVSEAEYKRRQQEMDALAANHGADTLKEIQN